MSEPLIGVCGADLVHQVLLDPMSTPMTKLELTLIAQARQTHERAAEYYGKRKFGKAKGAEHDEYLMHYHMLLALLSLAHTEDSGLSLEALRQLQGIEAEHVAAYQVYYDLPAEV